MGNLAFDISKIVDLNKVVTLDIDKNVDVIVDNPDILATAEADAEAFGSNALAEVDAFTYVNGRSISPVSLEVDVDALGNTTLLEQDNFFEESFDLDGDGVTDVTYELPNDITVNFDTPDGTGLPDIDDLNWTGGLIGNEDVAGDTPIPTEGFAPNDKNLDYVEGSAEATVIGDGVLVTAEYQLTQDWIVDFGTRTVTGELLTETDSLSLTVSEGTLYLVEFLDEDGDGTIDAKEYEFEGFPEGADANWVFGGNLIPVDVYVQDGEEIEGIGFGDWAFEALGTIRHSGTEVGEAFAYAESTAALDLNTDVTDVL